MSIDISEGIESGKVTIKVLTTNTTSITLLTEDKFKGKVIHPQTAANRLVGEHGLSLSFHIEENGVSHLFLMDTGGLGQNIVENSEQLRVNLNEAEKLILTHGHTDHWGGLTAVLPLLKEGTEFILNPKVYQQNYIVVTKSGEEIPAEELGSNFKRLDKAGKFRWTLKVPLLNKKLVTNYVEQNKINIIETNEPMKLYEGITTSGEIELFNEDEVTKGFYIQKSRNEFEKNWFRDETSIYINVKDKGLVVITGCGHCGIINTIEHGKKLTGIDKIYAVIGGFHEEWNSRERIKEKVKYFEEINPEIIAGFHCTGFEFNKLMSHHPAHTLAVSGTEFHL